MLGVFATLVILLSTSNKRNARNNGNNPQNTEHTNNVNMAPGNVSNAASAASNSTLPNSAAGSSRDQISLLDFLEMMRSFRADLLYQMDLKLATLVSQLQVNQCQTSPPPDLISRQVMNALQGASYRKEWPPPKA